MKVKMGIDIDSDLKTELEEFNFKHRKTEYKMNYSKVCENALKIELEKMRQASQKGTFKVKPFTDFEGEAGDKIQGERQEDARKTPEKTTSKRHEGKQKFCEYCGKEFTAIRDSKKTCSDKCRQAMFKEK